MTVQKDEIRREAGRMVSHYAPQFHEHGVLLDFHLRHFKEVYPDVRTRRQRRLDYIAGAFKKMRQIFTGEQAPKDSDDSGVTTVKSWSIILNFKSADNKKLSKDYSFVYWQTVRADQKSIPIERVMRSAERVINRKLRLLEKKDAKALCTDNLWDVARYIFGNYPYKQAAMGLDLSLLRFGLVIFAILIPSILYFVL